MITQLAHICLNVRNLERSLDYYQKLGFKPRFDFTRQGRPFGAYLEIAPGQYLEMFENPTLGQSVHPGLAHFCLESPDIAALQKELDAQGIAYTPKKLGCDHTYQIWLQDPDGNPFEIHQYTEKSLQQQGGTVEADW